MITGLEFQRFSILVDESQRGLIHKLGNVDRMNLYVGDTNLDGEFNSSDLVNLFTAAEYEDNVPMNSTWATGDFNGDGEFDSGDLVAAFADGGYEKGKRPVANAVPEPSGYVLFVFGLVPISLARHYKRSKTRRP